MIEEEPCFRIIDSIGLTVWSQLLFSNFLRYLMAHVCVSLQFYSCYICYFLNAFLQAAAIKLKKISKKTAQRNYSPVKYCNLFYQSRALLKGNTLFVLKIFVLINPYKCLSVLKITIQDYPAKLHSLKAACTNENCLSKPMDKSSYWETFLTILILEEVKTGKQLPIQTCFKQTSQCSRF